MKPSIVIGRKISLARLRVAELENSTSDFLKEQDPFIKDHAKSKGKRVVTVKISLNNSPDTVRWSLLMGEIAHLLRSSLDNLVYALAEKQSTSKYTKFPIATHINDFNHRNDDGLAPLDGLDDNEIEVIKKFQPFNNARPMDHALYLLQQLNNKDKHESPRLTIFDPVDYKHDLKITPETRYTVTINQKSPTEWEVKYRLANPFKTFDITSTHTFQVRVIIGKKAYGLQALIDLMFAEVDTIFAELKPMLDKLE